MRSAPHFRWVRPAQQPRSQETLERLLDSAERLIADKGFADVAVADIARGAGCSVGAFYARLRDKEGLLHCLQDRFVAEAQATANLALSPERWEGASIPEIAGELIAFLVEIHRERGGILRELLVRAPNDPEIFARKERLIAHLCDLLGKLFRARAEDITHPEPERAVSFGLRLVLGMLREAILFGAPVAYGLPGSDERLTVELTRAYLTYLGVKPPV
ncbi:MAG: TetR/AcrR family transcriptional regulator [Myxococcota bacterium]